MTRLTDIGLRLRIGAVALGGLVALAAWMAWSAPAQARVFVGIGVPFPGFYGPYPYYGYPYPAPYPPPAYYYPPPQPSYPPPSYPPPEAYAPPAAAPAAPTAAAASITYTNKPAFTNAAGQTCREFKTPQNAFGTACRDSDGQWRVQN